MAKNKKKKVQAAPAKKAFAWPWKMPLMYLYFMAAAGILCALIFSVSLTLAGNTGNVGPELILLSASFASVFLAFRYYSEGNKPMSLVFGSFQMLYGVYKLIQYIAGVTAPSALYVLVEVMYYILLPLSLLLFMFFYKPDAKRDIIPTFGMIVGLFLLFVRAVSYLNMFLSAMNAGSFLYALSYITFPLASILYYSMYLYGYVKYGNVSLMKKDARATYRK